MENSQILRQIKDEHSLGYDYMNRARTRYRNRLLKWNPQTTVKDKININMIGNAIDTLIASFWSNGVKVKFISKQGWIGQEEAENLNSVAEFDKKESARQQMEYQVEQDSLFFGTGILNWTGFDGNKKVNTWRVVNPLSWTPDPLPTQTGQFDGQNYRFHGFMMRSNVYDMKSRYDNKNMNDYFAAQYDSEEQLTRDTYTEKNGFGPITCDSLLENFSVDIYTHYTIINGRKRKFVTDMNFSTIFDKVELEATTKEEKLDPSLIPRPIMLNVMDPQRDNPLGGSICDKLETKQNAKTMLFNLNVIKAKKEAVGGDFLVNSRLIKNKEEFKKKTADARYFFVDEDAIGTNPIQNAMFELPQSQIKQDTFTMINAIDQEANADVKLDQMQAGLVPDKTMTKAEQQSIQANANNMLGLRIGIKSWFYQELYFQRWRGYQANFKDGQEKFTLLSADFEWRGVQFKKDEFLTKQIPYIMVGNADDINAVNEKQKQYLNMIYPQVMADPNKAEISKKIFERMVHKVNGLQANIINGIVEYNADERQAKEYIEMVNLEYMPKTIFDNPNADYYTYWLYLQKADDNKVKEDILRVLNKMLIEQGIDGKAQLEQDNSMANSAANIMMSQGMQGQGQGDIVSRPGGQATEQPL